MKRLLFSATAATLLAMTVPALARAATFNEQETGAAAVPSSCDLFSTTCPYTFDGVITSGTPIQHGTVTAVGTASQTSSCPSPVVTSGCETVTADYVLSDAASPGSTITKHVSGFTGCDAITGICATGGTFTITGGTGKYAGATGSGTFTGSAILFPTVIEQTEQGTINVCNQNSQLNQIQGGNSQGCMNQ